MASLFIFLYFPFPSFPLPHNFYMLGAAVYMRISVFYVRIAMVKIYQFRIRHDDFLSAMPLNKESWSWIYAGCRATHGVTNAKERLFNF